MEREPARRNFVSLLSDKSGVWFKYSICVLIVMCIFGIRLGKLFVLHFNNEKVSGKLINIEYVFKPGGNSYHRIQYAFNYNGEPVTGSFHTNTGFFNNRPSVIDRYYIVGDTVTVLYNSAMRFACVQSELKNQIVNTICVAVLLPLAGLVLVLAIKGLRAKP